MADRVRVLGDADLRTLTCADALATAYRLAGLLPRGSRAGRAGGETLTSRLARLVA